MATSDVPLYIVGRMEEYFTRTDTIDNNDEWSGAVFPLLKSGTISKICFSVGSVSTGATVDVRLETVSSGLPTGTLVKASANGAQVIADTDDYSWFETSLTSSVVVPTDVAVGTLVAAIVKNPASPTTPGNIQIQKGFNVGGFRSYTVNGLPTSAVSLYNPNIALKYSDDSYWIPINGWAMKAGGSQSISTSTTPEQFGVRFKSPKAFKLKGFWLLMDLDYDITVKLISGASTVETSVSISATDRSSTSLISSFVEFPDEFSGSADTYYRVVIFPETSNNVAVRTATFHSEALALLSLGIPSGWEFHLTYAKDPSIEGDWTNTTTIVPSMALLLSELDFGTSGGSSPRFGDRTGGLR